MMCLKLCSSIGYLITNSNSIEIIKEGSKIRLMV